MLQIMTNITNEKTHNIDRYKLLTKLTVYVMRVSCLSKLTSCTNTVQIPLFQIFSCRAAAAA